MKISLKIIRNYTNIKSNFKLKLLFIMIVFFAIAYFYSIYNELYYDNLINDLHRKNYKVIQLLTECFAYKNWAQPELGEKVFERCQGEKKCYAIKPFKYRQRPMVKSDAILVHLPNLFHTSWKKNFERSSKQIWVVYSKESQERSLCSSHYDVNDLDDWFNLTATFKPDSDFVHSYRSFDSWNMLPSYSIYMQTYLQFLTSSSISNKNTEKSQVFWFVSNCLTRSKREDYVRELRKHIKIDIYGNCKNLNSKKDPCANLNYKEYKNCHKNLYKQYKFYLAFENSLCNDYITEKFWNFYEEDHIFDSNVIPLVKGAKRNQYDSIVYSSKNNKPSFIYVDDFKSPKSLADYLNYLISNHSAFAEYFEWKSNIFRDFKISYKRKLKHQKTHNPSIFCDVCSMLHNQTFMNSSRAKKISEWFNPVNECWHAKYPNSFWEKVAKFFGYCV